MSESEDEFFNYPLKRKLISDEKSKKLDPEKTKDVGEVGEKSKIQDSKESQQVHKKSEKLEQEIDTEGTMHKKAKVNISESDAGVANNSSSEEEYGDILNTKEYENESSSASSLEDLEEEIFEDIIKEHKVSFHCNRFCTRKCQEKVCNKDLEVLKKDIEGLAYVQLRQYLLNLIQKQGQFHLDDKTFRIGSINVCCKYFSVATKVSKYITESVLTDYNNGVRSYNENLTRTRFSQEEAEFKAFSFNFATQYGESSPTRNSVSMPSYLTRSKMFHNYTEQVSGKPYTYSSFCRLLKKHYGPHRMDKQELLISFPKESKHSKCDQCLSLKQLKRNAKTKEQQQIASALLDSHHKRIGFERQNIWSLVDASKHFPLDHMFIAFDDMDQQKISFPRQKDTRKSLGSIFIMRSHLTGVQVYSGLLPENSQNILILNVGQFEQGSNKSVSILHQTLLDFKSQCGQLPLVLHVGADNCWRENKNKYVFGYLSALVKFGIFKEVTLNFLPVGHTHDSVDRMFGRIAGKLRKQNTNSCDELLTQLKQVSLKPMPVVKELLFTWNWKDFILPNFEEPQIENHSFFRFFKFSGEGPLSKMNYKLWSSDTEWVPRTGIKLLVTEVNFDTQINNAHFRIESINLSKIVSDALTKYIPTLPENERANVMDHWLKFQERINKLPNMIFPPMKLSDLSQSVRPPTASTDIEKWTNKDKSKPKEIVGRIIPEDAEQGDFRFDARSGMDACVYTREKADRPWLIRVHEVNTEGSTFTGVWLQKTKGTKGHIYKISRELVTLRTETVLLFGFTEDITDDGCSVSESWMDKVMKLYDDHDQSFI